MKLLSTFFFSFILISSFSQQVSTYIEGPANIDDCLFIASDGTMYASRFTGGTISKIEDDLVSVFSDTLSNANGITEDSAGNIYVADHYAGEVFKFDTDGNGVLFCDDIVKPSGLTRMPGSDTLIITSYGQHKVYKVDENGDAVVYIDHDLLNGPVSVNYDDDGFLFIGNYNDGKVLKYDHVNDSLHLIADLNITSQGFMCFANGFLFITSAGFSAADDPIIYRVDPTNGDVFSMIDNGYGTTDGDFSTAQFQRPNGIVASLDQTKLYISDYSAQSIRLIEGIVTSVDQFKLIFRDIEVYPNPSKGEFAIKVDGLSNERIELRIIDALGKEKLREALNLNQGMFLYSTQLDAGIYFIQIRMKSEYITKRIIIQ